MLISSKGRYALRLMVYMAQASDGSDTVALRKVSAAEGLSLKYLEQRRSFDISISEHESFNLCVLLGICVKQIRQMIKEALFSSTNQLSNLFYLWLLIK